MIMFRSMRTQLLLARFVERHLEEDPKILPAMPDVMLKLILKDSATIAHSVTKHSGLKFF